VIDGIANDMVLSSGETAYKGKYEFITTLSEGEHNYYFTASDGSDTNTSETFNTPKIEKPVEVDGEKTKKEGFAWEWLVMIIVIIVIVVLILVFLMIRRKKKEEWETIPAIQPETKEYEMQEPSIQEDLYYTSPEEPTPTMPDYTTPVQPEPEYEHYEQPEQPLEEKGVEELEE
jgi:flagellar biosynthesis/type III secretory pathway M-ring protein FliF/YscJ